MEQLLIKVSEAVSVTGISRAKLYSMIRRDEIPSVKIGKSIRIPVSDLKEWVKNLPNK